MSSLLVVCCWTAASLLPAAQPPPAAADESAATRVDTVLSNLEKRGDGLKDIRCQVRFVEDDQINLTKLAKTGRLLFQVAEPNPKFLIHFEKTEVDGLVGKQEWYLFDGQWLLQGLERLQQVTKQEIAPPGKKIDLFDLETAPFPLPFGQKKEKILRNFDVTLAAPASGDPPGTDHLVCTPKPGSTMDRKYDKLEFFVHRNLHLPVRIVITKNDGQEMNTAEFPDLSDKSLNTGVTAKDFAKPEAWKNYTEVVEELVRE